jgi:hypothetical protein
MKVVSIRVVNNRPQIKVKVWYKKTPDVYFGHRTGISIYYWTKNYGFKFRQNMFLDNFLDQLFFKLSQLKGKSLIHEMLKNSKYEMEQIPVLQDMIRDNRVGMISILGEDLVKILEA